MSASRNYSYPKDGANKQAKSRADHCEWRRDEDGIYETECGNMFEVIEGTTVENGMVFCPYCGGLLIAA